VTNQPVVQDADSGAAEPKSGPAQQSTLRVVRAAVVGTLVEYYDFGIYGYMATTLAALFFTTEDPSAALLGTFAAFGVAFFLRVPGGIFFGHLGDKYGRKNALSWTILLMVFATVFMGFLPTYATFGLWATAMLVLVRCLQGFAAGGELGGANVFVAESAPSRWRATQTSLVLTGSYLGSLAASLVGLAIHSAFSQDQILAWAWRMPFVLSLVLGVVGVWIRSQMEDTPQFAELEDKGAVKKLPITELLKTSRGNVVKVALLGSFTSGGFYIGSVYSVSYLQTVGGHSSTLAFASTSIALIVGIPVLPFSGYLADTYGRKKVIAGSGAAAVILAVPMFSLMAGEEVWQAVVGQTVLFASVSMVLGVSYAAWAEMFKASVRYSGLALGNNIAVTLFGGTAPFIATFLVDATGSSMAPAGYFIVCAAITFFTVFSIEETKGTMLRID